MKKEFKDYLYKGNKKGSQKASAYLRAIDLLDSILYNKNKSKLFGFKSIYEITSFKIINELYVYILSEQKNKEGIFQNEEPSSYWNNGFYSAALKSYFEFLKHMTQDKTKLNKIETNFLSFLESSKNCGLNFTEVLVTRFLSSLVTKPFVLLSGLSGSGKTKLAQSFAQWLCENDKQYCIVPVGADWTNREPLLGYVNALEENAYVLPENGALELIINANKNKDLPYFLILDEMNLSHVERYFADFLSVMESKEKFALHSASEPLVTKSGLLIEKSYAWPKNLFIVGTVNIDETTYMFSPKVLDRANVIEFRIDEDEMYNYLSNPREVVDLNAEGAEFGNSFVAIAKEDTKENATNLIDTLKSFFIELQKIGAEFGYRTASEIQTLFGKIDVINPDYLSKENEKIDIAIMQKLLPKLHGSRSKLVPVLKTLANLCYEKDDKLSKEIKEGVFEEKKNAERIKIYPISLQKIESMYQNVVTNGFTSYAEA